MLKDKVYHNNLHNKSDLKESIHNILSSISPAEFKCAMNNVINEEEEPTRCYLVFYYTFERPNMFRTALCPSSGAHDYISDYHTDRLILRLLMVGS
jgi:hypothetical protein